VDFVIPQKGSSLIEAYNTWRGWADPKGKEYDVSCTVNASNKRQPSIRRPSRETPLVQNIIYLLSINWSL